MNIAIVTSEFVSEKNFDGGLANYNYKLAKSLKAYGHRPVIIIRSDKIEKIDFEGIEVYRYELEHYEEWLYRNKYLCKPYSIFKKLILKKTGWMDTLANLFSYQTVSRHYGRRVRKLDSEIHFDIVH